MNKGLSYLLFLAIGLLIANQVHSQDVKPYRYTVRVRDKELSVKEDSILEAAKFLKLEAAKHATTPKPRPGKQIMEKAEIIELAKKYGLSQWISIGPSSPFTSYWYKQEPTEARLGIEFAALKVILKVAKDEGLNPEDEQLYSAPQIIIAALQRQRANLEKAPLVEVPDLANLSRAEAENKLVEIGLVPEARPQYVTGVNADRVVPNSQNPPAKLPVQPGALVSFAINVRDERPQVIVTPSVSLAVSLSQPKAGGKILCSRGGDSIYRLSVKGTSSGLSAGEYGLLLWLKPVRPPSDTSGWYLQRPPGNGVDRIEADGTWIGVAQLGSSQWPPHEGDVFDLAVSVADNDTINKLMAESGVVIRNQPVGVKSDTALGVVATLK